MHRIHHIALTLLAGAVAAACDGSAPSEPTTHAAMSQGREQVPFHETYHASGAIAPSTSCPGSTLLVSLNGGGTATHVGRYTITNSHCLDLATGAFTGGTFTKTAANGDQLSGTYSGIGTVIVAPNPVGEFAVNGTLTFTGGTGRFAGATGTASMTGQESINFTGLPFPTVISLVFDGSISPVGAAREPQ